MQYGHKGLVGKPEGRRLLEKQKRRWEDNIKIDPGEVGWGGMDLIDLAQDWNQWRDLVNAVTDLQVSENAGNFLST